MEEIEEWSNIRNETVRSRLKKLNVGMAVNEVKREKKDGRNIEEQNDW